MVNSIPNPSLNFIRIEGFTIKRLYRQTNVDESILLTRFSKDNIWPASQKTNETDNKCMCIFHKFNKVFVKNKSDQDQRGCT